MRVLVVGATGMLGTELTDLLISRSHDVVAVSRSTETSVDIEDPTSIAALYKVVGRVDAVAFAAGRSPTDPISDLGYQDFDSGLANKLQGQIELARTGLRCINDGGSFTLVSGITAYDPIRNGSVLATVNSGVDGFVRGVAVELPRAIRINAVSATVFHRGPV